MAYKVSVTIDIEKDGAEFCTIPAVYHNCDDAAMRAIEVAVVSSLLALGGDVPEQAKASKR